MLPCRDWPGMSCPFRISRLFGCPGRRRLRDGRTRRRRLGPGRRRDGSWFRRRRPGPGRRRGSRIRVPGGRSGSGAGRRISLLPRLGRRGDDRDRRQVREEADALLLPFQVPRFPADGTLQLFIRLTREDDIFRSFVPPQATHGSSVLGIQFLPWTLGVKRNARATIVFHIQGRGFLLWGQGRILPRQGPHAVRVL